MRRFVSIATALTLTVLCSYPIASGQPVARRGRVVADRLFTVADDFIVEVYHNGEKVPDARRKLLDERFGATAERIDVEVRPGDWLVFNVVNNRLRWGGCSYFAVTGRGEGGVGFTTELESGQWSCCDDPSEVTRFIADPTFRAHRLARPIEKPWSGGDSLMSQIADGWNGKPLWGNSRNTWIKCVVR